MVGRKLLIFLLLAASGSGKGLAQQLQKWHDHEILLANLHAAHALGFQQVKEVTVQPGGIFDGDVKLTRLNENGDPVKDEFSSGGSGRVDYSTTYEYDEEGRLVRRLDAFPRHLMIQTYAYGSAGELLEESLLDGNGKPFYFKRYQWLKGRLVQYQYFHSDSTLGCTTRFTYSGEEKLQTSTERQDRCRISGEPRSIEYSYNASGRIIEMIVKEGDHVRNSFDESGRLIQCVTEFGVSTVTQVYSYREDGLLAEMRYDQLDEPLNGKTVQYHYE